VGLFRFLNGPGRTNDQQAGKAVADGRKTDDRAGTDDHPRRVDPAPSVVGVGLPGDPAVPDPPAAGGPPRVGAPSDRPVIASPSGPEKVEVFSDNADTLYRLPAIAVTAKGSVVAACEARKPNGGIWGPIDILLKRSTDGGKTWGESRKVAGVPGPKAKNPVAVARKLADPAAVTYHNPVLISDPAGSVHLLFCLEYLRCFHSRSDDDGQTFSAPREITTEAFEPFRKDCDWKVLAAGPGHGIRLRTGRLVVPVWLSTATGGHPHRPSVAATIVSDDGGRTWKRGDIAVPSTSEWVDPNETTAAELDDGRVMLNVRSQSARHRRLVTISLNGATGWSRPAFDDALVEPICSGSLFAVPGPRPVLLFSNPDNLERADGKVAPGQPRDRKNLTIRASLDGGRTWPAKRTIEPGSGGYSDLATAADGTVLLLYERGSQGGQGSNTKGCLILARCPRPWVTP
jgi:sialidase-1